MNADRIIRGSFKQKLSVFEELRRAYSHDASKRQQFLGARQELEEALVLYGASLIGASKDERDKEYREALKYHEQATREYDPFVIKKPLQPGEPVPSILFNHLEAASVKRAMSERWLRAISGSLIQSEKQRDTLFAAGLGGAILGAALGGPAGLVAGGIVGYLLGQAKNEEDKARRTKK